MANTFISQEKKKILEDRMRDLGIDEGDIEEKFIHAQGRGGQKVNKTSSCVYLKHVPTGIEVKCQKARSQAMNRFFARRILADKVEETLLGHASSTVDKAARIRRQKNKRTKRAKAKISPGEDDNS